MQLWITIPAVTNSGMDCTLQYLQMAQVNLNTSLHNNPSIGVLCVSLPKKYTDFSIMKFQLASQFFPINTASGYLCGAVLFQSFLPAVFVSFSSSFDTYLRLLPFPFVVFDVQETAVSFLPFYSGTRFVVCQRHQSFSHPCKNRIGKQLNFFCNYIAKLNLLGNWLIRLELIQSLIGLSD
jgi:hypothetical protein